MTEEVEQALADEDRSILFIEFLDVGSVTFKGIEVRNMNPMQLLAIASYLELKAKSILMREEVEAEQAQEESQIQVASMKTPIEL